MDHLVEAAFLSLDVPLWVDRYCQCIGDLAMVNDRTTPGGPPNPRHRFQPIRNVGFLLEMAKR
jgi:hypothetical protein